MKLSGLYTAMITPFEKDGSLDKEGFIKNIHFQIEQGVDGLLILGTTAETPTLSFEEKETLIEIAVKEINGNIPLMVGTGSNSTKKTIELTKRAKELGANSALIVTPYYNKPTQQGILKHFEAITQSTKIPIVIYNIPSRTGTNIETKTLKKLSEFDYIIAVKEASGSISQIQNIISEISFSNPYFSFLSGDDALTLPMIALGGNGVISVISNLIPKQMKELVSACLQQDFEHAKKLHYRLLPLFKAAFIETNPIPIKTAMNMCSLPAGPCRLPLCEMSQQNIDILKNLLKEPGNI